MNSHTPRRFIRTSDVPAYPYFCSFHLRENIIFRSHVARYSISPRHGRGETKSRHETAASPLWNGPSKRFSLDRPSKSRKSGHLRSPRAERHCVSEISPFDLLSLCHVVSWRARDDVTLGEDFDCLDKRLLSLIVFRTKFRMEKDRRLIEN